MADNISLPSVYNDYINYYQKRKQVCQQSIRFLTRALLLFHEYLEERSIELNELKIDQIDGFLAKLFHKYKSDSVRLYRSYLRGFLKYLYYERQMLSQDLSLLVKARREYSKSKPPKFLRPGEIQKLFAGLKVTSPIEIRTYAIVHLAYALGLRPIEISKITLDDISFREQLLTIKDRKNCKPYELPIPEHTLKAIAAYIIGARPKSASRNLFVNLPAPHRPINAHRIAKWIKTAMTQVGLLASAYWLRHTHAQNLLEAGASIFEIKEMLGHDKIESTKIYLHVHIKLMREVLFDEKL
ncbi:tyrosine-type recombinase/integrase [Desulfobacterales bacterium HSG17]|nr:tyrosine-type recombinase/integrase [Desulfobacterales bacterium HSG17]